MHVWRGLAFVLVAASCWGLSATAAQALFQGHGVSAQWLTAVRMLLAGVLLYVALRPAFPRRDWARLLAFATLGFVAVQFTYLLAIQATNAAAATFLQYLGIPLIAAYEMWVERRRADPPTLLAIACALGGTAMLAFAGAGAGGLHAPMSLAGLASGVLAGVSLAFYTLFSARLVAAHGAAVTTTWGMLIGGVFAAAIVQPWRHLPQGDPLAAWALVAFVAIFGTLVAFGLFVASLAHIRPTEAGIAATFEPVAAAVAAFLFLNVALAPLQYAGGTLILAGVIVLRIGTRGHAMDARRDGPAASAVVDADLEA